MKAIVKARPEPGLDLVDVDMPEIGIDDVLIKIKKTSICGTDLHIDKWDEWSARTTKVPVVLGHEFVGEIAEIGSNVKGFKVGDRVSAEGHLVCGACKACLKEHRHLCPSTLGVGRECDGVFAEYAKMPACNVWRACPDITDEELSCFDPLGNAVHSALSFDMVGKDVLITGAGPIGCMTAAIARKAGARHVVVTDLIPYRLDLAKTLGATRVVNEREENLADVIQELNMEEGFDVGMEMSGSIKAFNGMIDVMANGGRISLLGILPSDGAIDWTKIIFKCITLKGIYGREIFRTWIQATQLIHAGMDIKPVITHTFEYEDYREAFDLMHSGQSGKIILNWEK